LNSVLLSSLSISKKGIHFYRDLLFIAAMGALIYSLTAFMQDLNESLLAFKLDIGMDPRDRFMK
jgi:hypothetical protein